VEEDDMTSTPGDDYETADVVESNSGMTAERGGGTRGPGPKGADLKRHHRHSVDDGTGGDDDRGDEAAESADTAERARRTDEQLHRTPGPGPDGSDLGEDPEEIGKVRREYAARHARSTGHSADPGPEAPDEP
jgi:hypothetical protein